MTESTALREFEVGSYSELSRRPNPSGLVILEVPALEGMLPFLEKDAGRRFTPDEIEECRQKHPSIALPEVEARKMMEARALRKT